ncbi:MAG: hypothetical protein Q8P57_00485 [Candidatus Pacearchaeota archaeon]|nr:hypothetical protein [Candidatus Pacearchaeota archaeon]
MVLDTRKVAKKDLLSKLSLVSKNSWSEGGFIPVRIISQTGCVEGDQKTLFSGIGHTRRVEGNQDNWISVAGYTGCVEGDQFNLLSGIGITGSVGGYQGNWLSVVRYTGCVERNQETSFSLVDVTKSVGGKQKGMRGVAVQTENRKANQSECLIRYNPLEGWGLGSSVWAKKEKADKYLAEIGEIENAKEIIESLVRKKPTLRKKITGHWTDTDVLSRQAKRFLKRLESPQEQ